MRPSDFFSKKYHDAAREIERLENDKALYEFLGTITADHPNGFKTVFKSGGLLHLYLCQFDGTPFSLGDVPGLLSFYTPAPMWKREDGFTTVLDADYEDGATPIFPAIMDTELNQNNVKATVKWYTALNDQAYRGFGIKGVRVCVELDESPITYELRYKGPRGREEVTEALFRSHIDHLSFFVNRVINWAGVGMFHKTFYWEDVYEPSEAGDAFYTFTGLQVDDE